jgi:hypothetical protein
VTEQSRQLVKCLEANDLSRIAMAERVLDIPMVLNKGTSISKLSKAVGDKSMIQSITAIIIRAMDSFNVGQKITDSQATILALDLLELMEHECVEDILLMFKYARQGRIGGKIFRIDNQVVLLEWFPAYLELKALERESNHVKLKSQQNNIIQMDWHPDGLNRLKSIGIGENEKVNEKNVRAPGLGRGMRKWLGQQPTTGNFGTIDNTVNNEFEYQKNKK